MRITVKVNSQWFVVPCGDGAQTVEWLVAEAVRRNDSQSGKSDSLPRVAKDLKARLAQGDGILSKEDLIKDVLKDNDFVVVNGPFVNGCGNYKSQLEQVKGIVREEKEKFLALDGCSLAVKDLVCLGRGGLKIQLTVEAENNVLKSRKLVEDIVAANKVVYGVTTGFGKFANVVIPQEERLVLQKNCIRSHAAGVGPALSLEHTRMLFALRINVLAKGYSGISLKTLKQLISAFNESCLPRVPEQGTVGASGDLAPLSHLALGMMGEGKMWSPKTGWCDAKLVLEAHGLEPVELGPKEGIALINGTQLITSIGAEAVYYARFLARQADIIAAITLEALKGTTRAFDKDVHRVRPHTGQRIVAERLRALLHSDVYPSEISESHRLCKRVQDPYTMRCCPQVHGIVNDTIEFVQDILTTEMNSATDNPIVFPDREEVISGGNFHGEYPAKALDYLAIGVHELASMSERRTERLINPAYSGLPAFLVKEGGLNSGFMLAHCTAAALVSENKVLCHPSSVDSLPTSAGTEDHVSMGGFSARKALQVVSNVEKVLAIELLAACQGIEFHRPLKSTEPLEAVHSLVRSVVQSWDKDRYMAADIEAAIKLIHEGKLWEVVSPFVDNYLSQNELHTEHNQESSSTFNALWDNGNPAKRMKASV